MREGSGKASSHKHHFLEHMRKKGRGKVVLSFLSTARFLIIIVTQREKKGNVWLGLASWSFNNNFLRKNGKEK